MHTPIRILHFDDNPLDARLVAVTLELERKRLPVSMHYVQTREEYLTALERRNFDIILSDYRIPGYDGDQALVAARTVCPDVPFIMVTGELGEELAIETLKRGATDYVLKDRLVRLLPAIERALGEAANEKKRRDAERSLQGSEEQYRRLVENIHDALVIDDVRGRIVFANDQFLQLFGMRCEDLDRAVLEDYVSPEYRQKLRDRHDRRMRGEKVPTRFEYKGLRRDGTCLWLDVSVVCLYEGGRPAGTQSTIRDISERKQAENALRETQERFAAAFRASPYPLMLSRVSDGTFVDVNDAGLNLYGTTRDRVIGHTSYELKLWTDPGDRDRIIELLKRDGRFHDYEARVWTPAHGELLVLLSATLLTTGDEQLMLIAASDVTRQRMAEQELRTAKEQSEVIQARLEQLNQELHQRNLELEAERLKWQGLIAGIADEVWACDLQGKVSLLNLNAQPGMNPVPVSDDALALLLRDREVLRPDGSIRPDALSPLQRSLRGEEVRGEELVRNKRTGEIRVRQHSAVPVRDTEGRIIGSAAIVRDITEVRRAEAEIRRLNEELEERVARRTAALERANRELESFSYTVSHDLKAPLRVIEGFAGALMDPQRSLPPDKQARYLALIRSSVDQMTKLIESLLEFARASRQVPQKTSIDMPALVEHVTKDLRGSLGEHVGRVQVVVGEIPRYAHGDPTLIRQVLTNILSNAFKFTRKREEATIEVGGYRRDGDNVYFVKDNGVGFPPGNTAKLFQVFQRFHPQEEFEGTGIGLASVRKIIERHGGEVFAEGEEGKGATFSFTLPAL